MATIRLSDDDLTPLHNQTIRHQRDTGKYDDLQQYVREGISTAQTDFPLRLVHHWERYRQCFSSEVGHHLPTDHPWCRLDLIRRNRPQGLNDN